MDDSKNVSPSSVLTSSPHAKRRNERERSLRRSLQQVRFEEIPQTEIYERHEATAPPITSLDDDEFHLSDSDSEDNLLGGTHRSNKMESKSSEADDPVVAQFKFMQHMDIPFIDDCSDVSKSDDDLDVSARSEEAENIINGNYHKAEHLSDNASIENASLEWESEDDIREQVSTTEELTTDDDELGDKDDDVNDFEMVESHIVTADASVQKKATDVPNEAEVKQEVELKQEVDFVELGGEPAHAEDLDSSLELVENTDKNACDDYVEIHVINTGDFIQNPTDEEFTHLQKDRLVHPEIESLQVNNAANLSDSDYEEVICVENVCVPEDTITEPGRLSIMEVIPEHTASCEEEADATDATEDSLRVRQTPPPHHHNPYAFIIGCKVYSGQMLSTLPTNSNGDKFSYCMLTLSDLPQIFHQLIQY